jgi:ABC-2 type transport system ATP-binding protein
MTAAITVSGLVKNFGTTRALDHLDLTVSEGEVHGFLGPNGAGKTTTIRVLLGLLRRDGGQVSLLGGDPWRDAVSLHRRLAYVPGEVNLWPNLTGGEVIDLLGSMRGGLDRSRRADLLDRFALDPTKRCRAYSKGNRQKVALVAALASNVELYLLDEPTSGLDPLMEAVFQDEVAARRGTHGSAVEPHPVRGRGAVRPGHHRARRSGCRVGDLRPVAAPDPYERGCRDCAADRRTR